MAPQCMDQFNRTTQTSSFIFLIALNIKLDKLAFCISDRSYVLHRLYREYGNDCSHLIYDYWNCGNASFIITFESYVEKYYPSCRCKLTPAFTKNSFSLSRLIYNTKDDLRFQFIKKKVYKPTIVFNE